MTEMKMDPQKQFSKWLARSGAVFWICYLPALLIVICIRPEAAMACVYLGLITSAVMIIHVWAYTRNSIYEKGLLAMLDKVRIQAASDGQDPDQNATDLENDEGESNG